MTTEALMCGEPVRGVPRLAVRVGRALEGWGRRVSRPIDRDAARREYERQVDNEARMVQSERIVRRPW